MLPPHPAAFGRQPTTAPTGNRSLTTPPLARLAQSRSTRNAQIPFGSDWAKPTSFAAPCLAREFIAATMQEPHGLIADWPTRNISLASSSTQKIPTSFMSLHPGMNTRPTKREGSTNRPIEESPGKKSSLKATCRAASTWCSTPYSLTRSTHHFGIGSDFRGAIPYRATGVESINRTMAARPGNDWTTDSPRGSCPGVSESHWHLASPTRFTH